MFKANKRKYKRFNVSFLTKILFKINQFHTRLQVRQQRHIRVEKGSVTMSMMTELVSDEAYYNTFGNFPALLS